MPARCISPSLPSTLIRLQLAVVLACAAFAVPALADVPDFTDAFESVGLDPAWTTADGYALEYPGDTANHAAFGVTGTHLSLSFPGGGNHNQFYFRDARVTRSYEGSGIYEVRMDTPLTGTQQFGLVFQSGPQIFLMFMLYANSNEDLFGYVERFGSNGSVVRHTLPGAGADGYDTGVDIPDPGPYYLRVTLADDPVPTNRTWHFEWSPDGATWSTIVNGVLEGAAAGENIGAITDVGIFAGNHTDLFSAFDARFDYWRTTPSSLVPLPAPADVTLFAKNGAIDLSWSPAPGADGYRIYRATSPGAPHTLLTSTTGTSFTDTNLANESAYSYMLTTYADVRESPPTPPISGIPHLLPIMPGVPQSGLLLALIGDELEYLTTPGGDVTSWPHAYGPATGASAEDFHAPTYVPSAIAGHGVARFDGASDFLRLVGSFDDFTAGMSVFVVARPTLQNSSFKLVAFGNEGGDDALWLGRNGSGAGFLFYAYDSVGNFEWFDTADALVADEVATYSIIQEPGLAETIVGARVGRNGIDVGSEDGIVPEVIPRTESFLGSAWYNDPVFDGDIAEVLIFDRRLEPAEEAAVLAYLDAKYVNPPPVPVLGPFGLVALGLTLLCGARPALRCRA